MTLQLERCAQALDHLLGGEHRRARVRIRQHQRELVATQPRHSIRGAQRLAQPECHLLQKLIPGKVAECVVDVLEAIQVDHTQRERPTIALRHADGLGQAVLQQQPVGQAGQTVVQRLMRQRFFGPLALGNVVDDRVQQLATADVDWTRVNLDVTHRA